LDIQSSSLPTNSDPECSLQLSHAAAELRKSYALNPNVTITELGAFAL